MSVFVFLGPTLPPDEARPVLDAVYLPPAAQGDLYRAALLRPQAIALVDGLFRQVPSVWHKEILFAMSEGVHVFGSSSMGALRAAELAEFGMEGVGQVFDAYRDGRLEDDDEVAVIHGAEETGYRPLSEAMVNIRATLRHAVAQSVLAPDTAEALTDAGKALFYPDRSFRAILRIARERALPAGEIDRFEEWLPHGRVDIKRLDALALLQLLGERVQSGLLPKRVHYDFCHDAAWEAVVRAPRQLAQAHQMIEAARSKSRTNDGDMYSTLAADYDAILTRRDHDIDFYVARATEASGPVLEVACGTGRLTLPMARHGAEVHALDASPAMLSWLRAKLADEPDLQVSVHEADMQAFDLDVSFGRVLVPFHAFTHLLDCESQVAALRAFHRHLRPNGRLVLDLPARRYDRMAQESALSVSRPAEYLADGRRLTLCEQVYYLDDDRRVVIDLDVTVESPGYNIRRATRRLVTRFVPHHEMEMLLRLTGFRIEAAYGGFDGRPYAHGCSELIFVAAPDV
jgi:SAM-dependent methyltransferase